MQVLRLATLALLAVCATSGCRTAGVDELARPGPPLASNTANVAAILAEHNRNAERIQVIRAKPVLTATIKDRDRLKRDQVLGLNGRMAMEQPRNFKLELNHTSGKVGDLGSNETEYWFWIKPRQDAKGTLLLQLRRGRGERAGGHLPARLDQGSDGAAGHSRGRSRRYHRHVRRAGKARSDPPAAQEQRQDLYPRDHPRSGHPPDPGAPAPAAAIRRRSWPAPRCPRATRPIPLRIRAAATKRC